MYVEDPLFWHAWVSTDHSNASLPKQTCQYYDGPQEVFAVSMMLLDRYLAVSQVPLERFQMAGAASILVAWKLTASTALNLGALCQQSDDSFHADALRVSASA